MPTQDVFLLSLGIINLTQFSAGGPTPEIEWAAGASAHSSQAIILNG